MSKLSERLKEIVQNAGVTQYMLAKNSGVDRALVCRFLSGTRIPSEENLSAICRALCLSEETGAELEELLEMAKDGEILYEQRRQIIDLFENIESYDRKARKSGTFAAPAARPLPGGTVTMYSDQYSVNDMIVSVLSSEYGKGKTEIRIFCPTKYEFFFSYLYQMGFTDNGNLSIKQAVRLENFNEKSSLVNTRELASILPFTLGNCRDYNVVLLYFGSGSDGNESSHPFPYYIVINDNAIMLSYDCRSAMLLRDPDAVEYIRADFDRHYDAGVKVTTSVPSALNLINFFDSMDNRELHPGDCMMGAAPALCVAFDCDTILSFRSEHPAVEQLVPAFRERFTRLHNDPSQGELLQVFTFSGIDSFIETGLQSELPQQFVKPFSLEMRLKYVSETKEKILGGSLFYAVNETKFTFPKNIYFRYQKDECVTITVRTGNMDDMRSVVIREVSVLRAFDDFLRYLPHSKFVLSKEKTVEMLEEREKLLRERIAAEKQ